MEFTLITVTALFATSLIVGAIVGTAVAAMGAKFRLGPAPRAFLSAYILIPSAVMITLDMGLPYRTAIFITLIYAMGWVGSGKITERVGIDPPEENDPPEIFHKMVLWANKRSIFD